MVSKLLTGFFFLFAAYTAYSNNEQIPPAGFIKNGGQIKGNESVTKNIACYAQFQNFNVYLLEDRIAYVVFSTDEDGKTTTYRADVIFENTTTPTVVYKNTAEVKLNFLKKGLAGKKPGIYNEVIYKDIYPGIDVEFFIKNNSLKYDIVSRDTSFANLDNIRLRYAGFTNINKADKDLLLLSTPLGDFVEHLPLVYGNSGEEKQKLSASYQLNGNKLAFNLNKPDSDNFQSIVIDPWTTFLGAGDLDEGNSIAIDANQNLLVTGVTKSVDFPATAGMIQDTLNSGFDAFVSKFDSSGSLIWSTYYGGSGDEYAQRVEITATNKIIVSGYSTSTDLLVNQDANHQDTSAGSYDGFILSLDTSGNYNWATYYGGTGGDFILASGITDDQGVILGGYTSSLDLPAVSGAYQDTLTGALDAFIAKLDSSGKLMWSTYYGGSNTEDVHDLSVDNAGNVIITGETYSVDFPVSSNAYQSNNAGQLDVFLVKFDPDGNRLWATMFGGSANEDANAIATDSNNDIYISGYSQSFDFPVIGDAYQDSLSGQKDVIIARFSASGQPSWTTYLGGAEIDEAVTMAIDHDTILWIAGNTRSADFPIIGNASQAIHGGADDGFYIRMNTAGAPALSSYLGGSNNDFITGNAVSAFNLAMTGTTFSNDFPVTSSVFQNTYGGTGDAFLVYVDTLKPAVDTSNSNGLLAHSVNKFNIFPNPARDRIHFAFPETTAGENTIVFIYNNLGKVVIVENIAGINRASIDISSIPDGIYYVSAIMDGMLQRTVTFAKIE